MDNHDKTVFYQNISPQELQEYAEATGFGSDYPVDLKKFKEFFETRKKILEVGCATGRLGRVLIRENFDYVGIDTNQNYLNYFKRQLNEQGHDIKNISFLEMPLEQFDVILFPWTVIGDFNKEEQETVIKKSLEMLNEDGIILLDNPAKGQKYNTASGYHPTKFYFDDWKDFLSKLDLKDFSKEEYTTETGRKREIAIIEK